MFYFQSIPYENIEYVLADDTKASGRPCDFPHKGPVMWRFECFLGPFTHQLMHYNNATS